MVGNKRFFARSQSIGPLLIWWERAIEETPKIAASLDAATVPEVYISTPKFPPALIPESTQSILRPSSGANAFMANRTQSAGVPNTAQRFTSCCAIDFRGSTLIGIRLVTW